MVFPVSEAKFGSFFNFFFLTLVLAGSPGWFVDGFRCFSVILS